MIMVMRVKYKIIIKVIVDDQSIIYEVFFKLLNFKETEI